MLIVASRAELPPERAVWGTGGWLEPEDREGLDWLTLGRLLGWDVHFATKESATFERELERPCRSLVVAVDPSELSESAVALLASRLAAEELLVVARAARAGTPFARLAGAHSSAGGGAGRALRWQGPGPVREWRAGRDVEAGAVGCLAGTETWAALDGLPLLVARRVGRGAVVTLAVHPGRARDADGACTALLRHLLVWGPPSPVSWLDLESTLVLRMDDLGGAQNVYAEGWSYPKLDEPAWAALRAELRRRDARLSLGYVAGWVDDGDESRGVLTVAGRRARRVPGRVHPSPLVRYEALVDGGGVHDYAAEFRSIQTLRAEALGDVELHGFTHMHPDSRAWAAAADRYASISWFRELGTAAAATIASREARDHPLELGVEALRRHFGILPTTLICPGDEWTDDVLERALRLDLQLVSSYYLALRHGGRFCWSTHVCAPYLDRPESGWFASGLPVVGYFHDYDPATQGVGWVGRWLDAWHDCGAVRLLDFRELAGALGRALHLAEEDGLRLTVTNAAAPDLVRPLPIAVRPRGGSKPRRLTVSLDGVDALLELEQWRDGTATAMVPA